MSSNIFYDPQNSREVMKNTQSLELVLFTAKLKNSIWLFGIPSWLFGIADRSVASLADGYLAALEIFHLFTAFFFFVSWLYLKPEKSLNSGGLRAIQSYRFNPTYDQNEAVFSTTISRMVELQEQHLIGQEYILPFPYFCQIYHLLNLKHLETIHNFSLNNLKVIEVSHFQPTALGGKLKFKTILESPFNVLRIWRQPIVEVELILHTPYTVELSIPVYSNKTIVVIFHAIPLSQTEHKFFIDIYSNLEWPRPFLQFLLHFASCLTLFEDLPYLQKLAAINISRLIHFNKVSDRETMWLFKRFVELYGSSIQPSQTIKFIE